MLINRCLSSACYRSRIRALPSEHCGEAYWVMNPALVRLVAVDMDGWMVDGWMNGRWMDGWIDE